MGTLSLSDSAADVTAHIDIASRKVLADTLASYGVQAAIVIWEHDAYLDVSQQERQSVYEVVGGIIDARTAFKIDLDAVRDGDTSAVDDGLWLWYCDEAQRAMAQLIAAQLHITSEY